METRNTQAHRTRLLYFVPLVALVFGFVLIAIDEANLFPWDQSHPSSNVGYYLWTGGLFLILMGIISFILAVVSYISLTRTAKEALQSTQVPDLSDQ